jgi:hypothetical protein
MTGEGRRLWPYGTLVALAAVPIGLLALVAFASGIRAVTGWPSEGSERLVLIGAFILSVAPITLVLIDALADRRAVIEYAGAKLDFSRVATSASSAVAVPVNIGVAGRAVTDSDTAEIVEALRRAVDTEVVVVDLEAGDAWWETRLLVLVSGAVRLRRPAAIVFVATEGGITGRFQGWATPDALQTRLLRVKSEFARSFATAQAAALQFAIREPGLVGAAVGVPALQPFAASSEFVAVDMQTGMPNEFAPERLLAAELGRSIEMLEKPAGISIVRLRDLFGAILHTDVVDESWDRDRQLDAALSGAAPYVAITHRGRYSQLLARQVAFGEVLKALCLTKR